MEKESVIRYVKASAAVLACAGVVVSPENQEAIVAGFLAIYGIVAAIHGKVTK